MFRIAKTAWLLAIFSGLLQILIFPLPNLYVLCWVATAPLVVAILRAQRPKTLQLLDSSGIVFTPASPLQGFALGYVSGIVWYAGTCYWIFETMHQYGGLSGFAALGVLILFCLYLALYSGAFGLLLTIAAGRRALSHRRALLLAPFLWVALELARTRITGFPWNLLGTAQVDNIPLARIAGFTGVYGISFEIMLVNTAVAATFLVRRHRRQALLIAAMAAIFVLQAGRWLPVPVQAPERTALLVQENIPILDNSGWTKDYFENTLRELKHVTVQPMNSGASHGVKDLPGNLVVWPESPAPFFSGDPLFRDSISGLARETRSWIVSGAVGIQNAKQAPPLATTIFNSAVLVSPAGDWVSRYDKVHLVPFGEYVPFQRLFAFAGGLTKEVGDFQPGTSRTPLDAGGIKLGVFICYESIFPEEVRQFARAGAQVLVNISNDGWYGDSGAYAQHLNQSRMRAIENDRWLLLDTNTGVTASVDPNGRLVAQLPRKVRAALIAPYALSGVTTFYTRHGDWFAYLCAIISVVMLLTSISFRRSSH